MMKTRKAKPNWPATISQMVTGTSKIRPMVMMLGRFMQARREMVASADLTMAAAPMSRPPEPAAGRCPDSADCRSWTESTKASWMTAPFSAMVETSTPITPGVARSRARMPFH